MPTYQYHCRDCAADLEVFQRMADPTLTVCPQCEGQLRKVFSAVGVVFKGSGFYATDSRNTGRGGAKTAAGEPAAPKEAAAKDSAKETAAKTAAPKADKGGPPAASPAKAPSTLAA
jgi:putative FmdB family regulatory protein